MSDNTEKRIVIIGGGLVGSLEALFCAQRSYVVDVYEQRPDPRTSQYEGGRSINLALSERGRAALRSVGAEEDIVKTCIPMRARMLHSFDGKRTPVPYGTSDQYILSVDRQNLNVHLINLADKCDNITYHFCEKFVSGDFDEGIVVLRNGVREHSEKAHLIIGCDGSFSGVRRQLMKTTKINYSQFYIPHRYKEIEMPPNKDGGHAMELNFLHIWPRQEFMMIALPNQSKTFTCTLFMPDVIFNNIQSDEDILGFFRREFPDAIALIGEEKILKEFKENATSDTVCIKTSPYHYKDKVVVIGDAAHAMVPFYGQGMNCGFEDCIVLHEILDRCSDTKNALEEFSATRNPDAEAIVDLALYNYVEMRSHVTSPMFRLRKLLDGFLHCVLPNYWVPLYTMTTFTRIRYHHVIARRKRQDQIIKWSVNAVGACLLTFAGVSIFKNKNYLFNGLPDRMKEILKSTNIISQYLGIDF